ncbi:MAG: hypothetical protein EBX52_05950 [Proteobacteria bacterium]|nr:hypothetical protein [Pseudomonadota bacterium]
MKRKEKTLTLDEIKERMIQAGTTSWLHSAPLFGMLHAPDGSRLIPLSNQTEGKIQILFLLDAADYHFDQALDTIERLRHDYRGLPWQPLIALEQKYLFLRNIRFFDRFRHSKSFATVPVFLDAQGEWFERYQAKNGSKVVLLHQTNEVLNLPLLPDFGSQIQAMEKQLHEVLRLEDPGLPLLETTVTELKKPLDRRTIPARELVLSGNWIQANDSVVSEDSTAGFSFNFEGSHLRIVAITHPNARETARFTIQFNDEPLPSAHYGVNTRLGDKGSALSEINRTTGLYELISSNLLLKGKVTIRFMNAVENPVILYGLRTA